MFFICLFFWRNCFLFCLKFFSLFFSTREFASGWMNPRVTSLQKWSLVRLCVLSMMMSVVMWIIVPNSCGDSIFAIQQFCKCPHTGCSSEAVGLNRVYVRFYFVRPPGPYTVYIYIYFYEGGSGISACADWMWLAQIWSYLNADNGRLKKGAGCSVVQGPVGMCCCQCRAVLPKGFYASQPELKATERKHAFISISVSGTLSEGVGGAASVPSHDSIA